MMNHSSNLRRSGAFTLIELLVVISIIGLLASLVVALAALGPTKAKIAKTRTELNQLITVIEAYKAKKGYYPPDTQLIPNNAGTNQLYYELVGTTNNGTVFVTLGGKDLISLPLLPNGVATFNNSTKAAKGSDDFDVQNFHKALKDAQTRVITVANQPVRILVAPVEGPNKQQINPWHYVSSNPTNNPGTFDLWANIIIAGKTNRISNWSKDPEIIGQ